MVAWPRMPSPTDAGQSNVTIADVMTTGAHMAIAWHPAGAHGRRKGVSSDEVGVD